MPDESETATPRSAVVVLVPEAAEEVGPFRARLDPRAAEGIPEHITILYPFLPPGELADGVVDRLAGLVAGVPAFDYALTAVRWFGRELMWLAPEPVDPFVTLTERVAAEFGTPPYAGDYPDVTPHLTVGCAETADAAHAAEPELAGRLPIRARVEACHLMVCDDQGRWAPRRTLPLGADR